MSDGVDEFEDAEEEELEEGLLAKANKEEVIFQSVNRVTQLTECQTCQ